MKKARICFLLFLLLFCVRSDAQNESIAPDCTITFRMREYKNREEVYDEKGRMVLLKDYTDDGKIDWIMPWEYSR